MQFVALNDGSTINNIQIVLDMERFTDEQLKAVTTGAAIHVDGRLVESMGKGQTCEIQADSLEVFGTADPDKYPSREKGHTLEFLREIAHLRPRTNTFGAVLRIRSALAFAIHRFFQERGFFYLNTPLSPRATAREQEPCSRSPLSTWPILPATRSAMWTTRRTSSASPPHSP